MIQIGIIGGSGLYNIEGLKTKVIEFSKTIKSGELISVSPKAGEKITENERPQEHNEKTAGIAGDADGVAFAVGCPGTEQAR